MKSEFLTVSLDPITFVFATFLNRLFFQANDSLHILIDKTFQGSDIYESSSVKIEFYKLWIILSFLWMIMKSGGFHPILLLVFASLQYCDGGTYKIAIAEGIRGGGDGGMLG